MSIDDGRQLPTCYRPAISSTHLSSHTLLHSLQQNVYMHCFPNSTFYITSIEVYQNKCRDFRQLKNENKHDDVICRTWSLTETVFLHYRSICLWLYSHLLDLGRFFILLMFHTVIRIPWIGDQPVARPLPAHRTAQTQNKRTRTSMPQVRFEPTIPVFERAKTVHALDSAATVIGSFFTYTCEENCWSYTLGPQKK
jgi:hypothetical protein